KARALLAESDAEVKDSAMRARSEPGRHEALAEIALAEHKPLVAVAEFRKSDSLPDGPVNSCPNCVFAAIGRAFDLADMPDSAISYWERYLGTVTNAGLGDDP